MALFKGRAKTQTEVGDTDPSTLSSTVVASSSTDDNCTTMGSGACSFISKFDGA